MTDTPVIWGVSGLSSLALHGVAAGVLLWAIQPDPVPVQPTPETELQLSTYQVERTQAQESTPEGESAQSADTSGVSAGQTSIPTSRATAVAVPSDRAEDVAATGTAVGAADPQVAKTQALTGSAPTQNALAAPSAAAAQVAPPSATSTALDAVSQSVTAIAAPEAEAVSNLQPLAAAVAVLEQPATPLASIAPQTETPVALNTVAARPLAVATPRAQTASAVQPTTLTAATFDVTPESIAEAQPVLASLTEVTETPVSLPTVVPDAPVSQTLAVTPTATSELPAPLAQTAALAPSSVDLSAQATVGQDAAPVAPPQTSATAMLVFPGSEDGPIDPVSLQAFQSFMQPDDPTGAAAEVRDGISGFLSAVPCSRVQARFDPDANELILTGHVPEDALRGTVLAAMQNQMGADIPVREDLLILPRPQCGALAGISNVGLPQSTDQITNPLLVGEDTHAVEFKYVDGQALVLDLQGADYDAFVYVDYFDADGNVLHLAPNEFTPLTLTEAEAALRIGSDRALAPGEPGLFITIGPPYGQEIAVAFASSVPLYEGIRPLVEPADTYLDWLRQRVSLARDTHDDFKGEWVYFFVSTSAR